MAIFHLHASIISRKTGRSSVAAAAYRSGEKLVDERTGEIHDYTKKRGIYDSAILAPDYAPEWVYDRESLWNVVESVEKRHDAQLARDIDLALPTELSHFQKRSLVHEFFQRECVDRGMIADINLHDFNSKNPHAHVLLSMRYLTEAGFGNKNREWNEREFLQQLRADWSDAVNLALARAGHQERIDHRSLEAQGIERIPQIHLGPNVCQMELKGIQTERGDRARAIDEANRQIQSLEIQLKATEILIHNEREREARERERQAEAKRQAAEAQKQRQIDHINSLFNEVVETLRQQTANDNRDASSTEEPIRSTPEPVELPPPAIANQIQPPAIPISKDIDRTAAWAAEIAPIAGRLFEYYADQGVEADFTNSPTGPEAVYEVNAEDRVYWLSRNEATGEYNLRGRDLDLSLNRGVTEKDRDIWRDWGNWLDQQAKPQPQPAKTLTLETVANLSAQDWRELTPRQQLKLVDAAKQHRRTEPQGYTQPEQWVGQRSQLENQIKHLKGTEREAKATLDSLEERGERSLFNPLGASWERLHDARESLRHTQADRKSAERDLKAIIDRQTERQKQDAARAEWRTTPQAQGALQVLKLIEQPDLKAQFNERDRTYQRLVQWYERVKLTPQAENVRSAVAEYLDGQGLTPQAQHAIRDVPTQLRQQSKQLEM